MSKIEVIQSLRSGIFGGIFVLGSQYRGRRGSLNWYVALLRGHAHQTKVRHVLGEELPYGLDENEREAIVHAIKSWRSPHATLPRGPSQQGRACSMHV